MQKTTKRIEKPIIFENDELIFIGGAIRYHRLRHHISKQKMADILNISINTYTAKENNNKFTPEELDTCAKNLNLNITFTLQEAK